jgi:hypothetical protein
MNLRSHTYLIPALCGTAAFAALVASDFGIRRLAHGADYGMASYLVEVATPEAKKPARVAMAAFQRQAAPAAALAVAVTEPEAEPAPVIEEIAVTAVPEPQPEVAAAVTAPVDGAEAPAVAEPEAALVRIAAEPAGFAASCSADRGFKRCRIGD